MGETNYILGKHILGKQIVYYCYFYQDNEIRYRFSFPYVKSADKDYYIRLVDEKVNQLKANNELDRYAEEYLKKQAWRKKYGKPVKISCIAVGAAAVIGLTIGLVVTFTNRTPGSNVVLTSETLSIDHNDISLYRDVNLNFKVNDFYVNYGYYLPDSIDEIVIGGEKLTNDKYEYTNGHLKISGQYVTDKVYITAEADYVHFEDDSWDNIIKYAKGGLKEVYLRYGRKSVVGSTHDLEIGNEKVQVRVIGEGHDRLESDLDQAGTLTLEFVTPLNYSSYSDIHSTCDQIYNRLPTNIKSGVNSVSKRSFDGSEISSNSWNVFPLSYREINGYETVDEAYRDEESCYEYYQELNETSLKEKRKKNSAYWLRDIDVGLENVISIDENGSIVKKSIHDTLNLAPAFTIGKTISFTTDTWDNVVYYANYGLDGLKEHYGLNTFVGLERELKLNDDTLHHVHVIGENHDALSGGNNKVAALTFEFVDPLTNVALPYNDDLDNSINYSESSIRAFIDEQMANFPNVLVENIPYVSKKTVEYKTIEDVYSYPIPSCETTDERLFLLSVREVGDVFYGMAEPYSLEEEAYQYYRTSDFTEEGLNQLNKKRIKNANNYWLRSHYCMDTKAHIVDYQGRTFGLFGQKIDTIVRDVDQIFYCYPAFSLGYSDAPLTFANDSWENVCYQAGFGLDHLKDYYQVDSFIGYQKEIILNEETGPQTYTVRVIGENEDTTLTSELAALTFEFTTGVTPVQGSRYEEDVEVIPHYTDSVIRNYCNNVVLSKLPEILQDSIKTVKKRTAAFTINESGEREYVIDETEDKLFVLSRNEISDTYDVESEEIKEMYLKENPTYSYYQKAKAMVRYKASNDINGHYWLRTPFLDFGSIKTMTVHCINAYGYFDLLKPTNQLAVAPAFSI